MEFVCNCKIASIFPLFLVWPRTAPGTAPGTAVLFSYISMLFVLRLCLIQDVVEVTLKFWALKIRGGIRGAFPRDGSRFYLVPLSLSFYLCL